MTDDLPEVYALETIEQLRAISDALRIRIIDLLSRQPMTVTQLGERLGIAPAKVHYHVRELERVGLLRLVETREKGGVLEKYYRTVASDYRVPPSLLRSAPPDEVLAVVTNMLNVMTSGLLRAVESQLRDLETRDDLHIAIGDDTVYMTDGEVREVMRQIGELLKPYEEPRGGEGERQHTVAYFAYPNEDTETTEATDKSASTRDDARTAPSEPKARTVVIAGAFTYSRRDLESVLERGKRLKLYVLGHLTFTRDVSAELADQAIASLWHTGTLSAAPEVRAVLKGKQQT